MNLHQVVSNAVGSVNPFVLGRVQLSSGYTIDPKTRVQVPTYEPVEKVWMQIQPLTYRDMQQLSGLNLQGTQRKVFINGRLEGVIRADVRGGDLISFPYPPPPACPAKFPFGTVWLVVQALETWPNWCNVAVTLQNGA